MTHVLAPLRPPLCPHCSTVTTSRHAPEARRRRESQGLAIVCSSCARGAVDPRGRSIDFAVDQDGVLIAHHRGGAIDPVADPATPGAAIGETEPSGICATASLYRYCLISGRPYEAHVGAAGDVVLTSLRAEFEERAAG